MQVVVSVFLLLLLLLWGFVCLFTCLHASPIALIPMRKTALLSTELLTITILGKVSLVASEFSSAEPLGCSWTATSVFLLLSPIPG